MMPKTIFMKTTQKNGRFVRRSTQEEKKRFKSNILSKIEDESFFLVYKFVLYILVYLNVSFGFLVLYFANQKKKYKIFENHDIFP